MVYDITDLEILQVCISDLNKDRSAEPELHLLLAKLTNECCLNYICIALRQNSKLLKEETEGNHSDLKWFLKGRIVIKTGSQDLQVGLWQNLV